MPDTTSRATRLALEGLVIVASILAAFALDAGWDEFQERDEEAEVLADLRGEFTEARSSIEFYRSLQERILHSVTTVVDSVDAASRRGSPAVTLADTTLGLAYIPPTTSVRLGTLDGLVTSGRLNILRSRELRKALALWGKALEELTEEEVDLRALAYGEMDRELREVVSTAGLWRSADLLLKERLPVEDMEHSRSLPVSTDILGVMVLRQSILTHALDEFEGLLAEVDEILGLIEAAG